MRIRHLLIVLLALTLLLSIVPQALAHHEVHAQASCQGGPAGDAGGSAIVEAREEEGDADANATLHHDDPVPEVSPPGNQILPPGTDPIPKPGVSIPEPNQWAPSPDDWADDPVGDAGSYALGTSGEVLATACPGAADDGGSVQVVDGIYVEACVGEGGPGATVNPLAGSVGDAGCSGGG